jgi:translation initiation factor 2 alpha subunit (eIF-2alpha)
MNNYSNYNKFVTNVLRVAHNPPELDTSFVVMTKQETRNKKQETKKPQTTENLRLFL